MDGKQFVNRQSGGMFAIYDAAVSTGRFFFVHSGTGSDTAGSGRNPDDPFASINYAFSSGVLTADKHDIVYVMPGHAEAGTDAGFLDLDIAGVTIIGIGQGTDQPTVTHGHADADVDIDAANITIENIHFIAGIDDVKVCLDVNADDFTVRNCRFTGIAADKDYLVCVQDAAATASDRITVEGCFAVLNDAAVTEFIDFGGTGDGHIVRDNILYGAWTGGCIGGGGIVTHCAILNNAIYNIAAGADLCITMAATATGIMAGNMCTGGHATDGIIPGDLGANENYYVQAVADDSGKLEPPAT